ncbi:spore coat protein GerQ [Bacillus chungangensis]|uniref:Spore coat protein GerQ n=1 Tax=Bacillus chungangensis TaxID=587633 RepID=A0ABT9WWJ9_9BACI|nr:spore coat protein GerQ [Bacillus chungangensis]MDQ0177499.1 spore germination protein Q [Bacillus chungangensis]
MSQSNANQFIGYQMMGGQPYMYYPQAYGQQQAPPALTAPAAAPTPSPAIPGMLPLEESYIENILRLNKGKLVSIYATFEHNPEWNAKIFEGIIEAAGRDHVVLSDPQTGERYVIPMIYVDYIKFKEPIEYEYPLGARPPLAGYTPR